MAYETEWIPIVELQDGQVVADKLEATFANIDVALDALEVTEALAMDNDTRIDTLENPPTPAKSFTYSANAGMTVSNDVYDNAVGVLHTVTAPTGDVMYGYSVTFSGTQGDKLHIEMTVPNIDGTAGTPFEHVFEVKDSAEVRPKTYFFPRTHTVPLTDAEVRVRFRKGSGDVDFTVNFIDVMTEIKK